MVHERQVMRGFLANLDSVPPLIVSFRFNPESIRDNKAVSYADRDADLCGNAPGKVYTGSGHRTISFTLQLHGLEEGTNRVNPSPVDNGISTELAKLRSFLYPKEDAWASMGSLLDRNGRSRRLNAPPICLFGFGTRVLRTRMTDLGVEETQFNSALAPVRAEVGVTLTVIEEDGDPLYELDKHKRNALAALGLQNVRLYE